MNDMTKQAGAAAATQVRRTDGLIQRSGNLADELRGLNYRLTAFVGAMVTPQPENPVSAVPDDVAPIEVKLPALEQLDCNLEEIRHQTNALSATIAEAELL